MIVNGGIRMEYKLKIVRKYMLFAYGFGFAGLLAGFGFENVRIVVLSALLVASSLLTVAYLQREYGSE